MTIAGQLLVKTIIAGQPLREITETIRLIDLVLVEMV